MSVQRITPATLQERYGDPSVRRWERMFPYLVRLGLVVKTGRAFYGDIAKIDAALLDGSIEREIRPPSLSAAFPQRRRGRGK